jgi:hypothetical protein
MRLGFAADPERSGSSIQTEVGVSARHLSVWGLDCGCVTVAGERARRKLRVSLRPPILLPPPGKSIAGNCFCSLLVPKFLSFLVISRFG